MPETLATNIFCPHCATEVEISSVYGAQRLLTAIMLQSCRLGAELYCRNCETSFVYQRIGGAPGIQLPAPHHLKHHRPSHLPS